MQKLTSSALRVLMLAACAHAAASVSSAQSYPAKPIRVLVGFSAGGSTDVTARLVAQKVSDNVGQTVLVENRPGASGSIAIERVLAAPADGYTLIMISASATVEPALHTKLAYDLQRDLAPIALYYAQPGIVMVHPSVRINSIRELIAYAKAKPRDLRYASTGYGAIVHFTTEYFAMSAGISMTHVPYRGGGPAIMSVISGEVDMMFLGINTAASHVKSGRLRALGVTTKERVPVFPDVPAVAEQGLPGFDMKTWYALFAPANTPKPIVDRLQAITQSVVAEREFSERLAANGGKAVFASSDELRALVDRELKAWSKVIKAAKLDLE